MDVSAAETAFTARFSPDLYFRFWREMLSSMPISKSWKTSAVPPALKNGSDMPVFGKAFEATIILSSA